MADLRIILNQPYKSFEQDFSATLSGELIILSGVNGSGKTQIIDIIKGYEGTSFFNKIQRNIYQDGKPIEDIKIIHKSFRDYKDLGGLSNANVRNLINTKDNLFNWYQQNQLSVNLINENNNNNNQYQFRDATERVKSLLIKKFGGEKFMLGTISREDFNTALPSDFVLFPDDIFTNKIGEIFFNYVSLVYKKEAEAGRSGLKFDPSTLPPAPWDTLNKLFEKLKFSYRFKSEFRRIDDEINEQPIIYALNEEGTIDNNQPRHLQNLSDGEKALISLTFAVIATEQVTPQILLLDEYEATLNPSLIESFFTVIHDFFLSKGVQVIVVTHSPATLSLAPEYANFYEVYKPNKDGLRVLPIFQDQYAELAIANRKFYKKIDDQATRIEEIKLENNNLKSLLEEIKANTSGKLQIISEGKNVDHIQKAIELLQRDLIGKIEFVKGAENATSKEQMKMVFNVMSQIQNVKVLFIWDVDALSIIQPITETDTCKKFCFEINPVNELIQTGIENLYPQELFTDDLYQTKEKTKPDGSSTIFRSINKDMVLMKVISSTDSTIFTNYKPLLERIKTLV